MAESVYDMLGRRRGVRNAWSRMRIGMADILRFLCFFHHGWALSLPLPPSTFACCVHKASRVAPTISGSVMSEGKFVV